jgi:hypothetical protein
MNSFSITEIYAHIYKTQKVLNGGVKNDSIGPIKKDTVHTDHGLDFSVFYIHLNTRRGGIIFGLV